MQWNFKNFENISGEKFLGAFRKNIYKGPVAGNSLLEEVYDGFLNRGNVVVDTVAYPNQMFSEPVQISLEDAKRDKIQEIDQKTQDLITSGFDFDNARFSMSAKAQDNWSGLGIAYTLGFLSFPLPVSTVDEGIYILADETALLQFLGAYMQYQSDPSQPLGAGRLLKTQVSECTTVEEVEAIIDNR